MAKSSFFLLVFLATTAFAQEYGTNYNAGDHGRSETVGPDGEVQGQYQYTDPEGKLITVKYRAGKEGFQVEGDHLPRAPQPGPPGPPQQPQQPFYNPQQYQQPQQFQSGQYQPQPQQQPQFNPFFNQQQPQVQPQASPFQNFGQNQFQGHPNALPGQFQQQPQAQPQFFSGQEQPGQRRPATVMVSQQPGAGFMYSLQT